uniref:t-SNARE coiled-coil homology domain-containing protein n=1 Tax=Poecilia mexicana TaxID=48701 RepID=A0A3B3WJF2_9TELE
AKPTRSIICLKSSNLVSSDQNKLLLSKFLQGLGNSTFMFVMVEEKWLMSSVQLSKHQLPTSHLFLIVDKVTTDDELEDMLQRDNLAIFITNIHSDAQLSSRALSEIERRHQNIISLEYSIKELHEIITDTAMLLEIQGELINNIEKNVTSAGEYVDAAKEETHEALGYKKNRYKVVSLPRFFKSSRRQAISNHRLLSW